MPWGGLTDEQAAELTEIRRCVEQLSRRLDRLDRALGVPGEARAVVRSDDPAALWQRAIAEQGLATVLAHVLVPLVGCNPHQVGQRARGSGQERPPACDQVDALWHHLLGVNSGTLHGTRMALPGYVAATLTELRQYLELDALERTAIPGALARQFGEVRSAVGSAAGAANKVASSVGTLVQQQRQQTAAVARAVEALQAAAREAQDAVAALQAQAVTEAVGDDVLTLLVRFLREEPAVWRHVDDGDAGDLICWFPAQVGTALVRFGVPRVETERVRRSWRELGLVPADGEAAATFNRRLRDRHGRRDYWAAVPVQTFLRLRVRVPSLPTDPPGPEERRQRAQAAAEALRQAGSAPTRPERARGNAG